VAAVREADRRRRVFFASVPEPNARAALVRWQRRALARCRARGLRAMAPAALHVTLRFLGERDAAEVAALLAAAGELPAAAPPFQVRCGALRLLPSARRPRVLAVELDSGGALEALAAAARAVTGAVGIEPDPRPFLPHLTLARLRPGPVSLEPVPPPPGPLAFGHVGLYESRLEASGARYRALWRAPLSG
jgi:2'-5' RNA ligase